MDNAFVILFPHQQEETFMARFSGTAAFVVMASALCISANMYSQVTRAAQAGSSTAANVTNDVLRRTGAANDAFAGYWLSYRRTQSATRYRPRKEIDTATARRLGLAWSYVMGAGGGNQEGTPLMWNNTL